MNNNREIDYLFQEGYVTSLAVPYSTQPGFAIPLVQSHRDSNVVYVQRVDHSRKIIGFDIFQPGPRVVRLDNLCVARVGDPEIYALIDPNGQAFAGTQEKLSNDARGWITSINEPFLRMNFARFCDKRELAEHSAIEAVRGKAKEFENRDHAVLWFVDSVIVAELTKMLIQSKSKKNRNLNEEEIARNICSARLINGRITIDIPQELMLRDVPRKKNYRLSRLLNFTKVVTGLSVDLISAPTKRASSNTNSVKTEDLKEIEEMISKLGRQERRISVLLDIALSNADIGRRLLDQYIDRAQFMRGAITKIRNAVNSHSATESLEEIVAKTLPSVISYAYPLQKGRLLLELAAHLNSYSKIAAVLRAIVLRSNSREVETQRSAILEYLQH